jgi:small nuclear ribonucleoprotein (snRNP)-like protein
LWYIYGMSYQYKLQIPIPEDLNKQLKEKVKELGFSSISEATRFLLINLVNGNLSIGFSGKALHRNDDLENLVLESVKEQKDGKTKKLDFTKPLHNQIIEDL